MVAMVKRLSQYISSLFFKIFLAFWVILILTVGTALLIMQLSINTDHPLPDWARQELQRNAFMLHYGPPSDFPFLPPGFHNLLQPHSSTPSLILVSHTGEIVNATNMGRNRREIIRFILSNDKQKDPKLRILGTQRVVFGPQKVQLNGSSYLLYINRKISPEQMDALSHFQMRPETLIGMLVVFSLIACIMLAWHIAAPLKKLRNAANQIAMGDLSVKLPDIHRRDEVGQLAESLSQMSTTLSNAITNQQRLLSDISHELRSPLTRLNMAVALSNKRYGATKELQRIEREAERLEEMIRALLGLSRMQLDESKLEQQNLNELLEELTNDCQFEASQVGKTFILSNQGPEVIYCFPEALLSAVENLCRNAIKYASQTIELTIHHNARQLMFSVIDDGPGIPEDELKEIFRPFYRASEARDRDSGGVGLGLAIADWAVRQHGGRIEAKNRATQTGLSVTIYLPHRAR
ncbi:ATP-binding protein [Celerinatantimonas diazotrophica]|uniref:histidine kinase n=1 Tax=Celerinatantimonas diazotrophica TaxID=412034 RepID=A0A4R1J9K8_9GAMM|nr:ATP-binding protein [Celerinatantimonas diazotrophica]TCK46789.1 two-component system sensor histidine kinase CpxA [Celerinatantimonas diazotrophica]CAG9295492.1 Sensor histidine kinase CpxA [Celerinatantimonas diazotrophica]